MRRRALVLIFLALSGCNHTLGQRLVEAQNFSLSMRGRDADERVLKDHLVTRQLRIRVGPPQATYNVWIVDPIEGEGLITLNATSHGYTYLTVEPLAHLSTRRATTDPAARLTTRPTTRLATLPTTNPTPRATLFLLHGITEGKEWIPYQFWATTLRVAGFRVILLDLRGHGRSTGSQITYGAVESRDLVQVLDELEREKLIIGNVGVLGGSYGAACAICWAAIDPRVKAVVALEPFDTLRHAAHDVAPTLLGKYRKLFTDRDIQDAVTDAGKFAGFDPDLSSPYAAIATMKTPVLLIHGKNDTFLSPSNSERLYAVAKDHAKLILVPNATHIDLWHKGYPLIYRESDAWFSKYLHIVPRSEAPSTFPSSAQPSPELTPIPQPTTRPSRREAPGENHNR